MAVRAGPCGTGSDVCCYVDGSPCPHLERTPDDPVYNFACGLFQKWERLFPELDEDQIWAIVHNDPLYLAQVKPTWVEFGVADCGVYEPSTTCPDCGLGPTT